MGADALSPEAFDCLNGHPSLRAVLGRVPRHEQVVARLPAELQMDGFCGSEQEAFSLT